MWEVLALKAIASGSAAASSPALAVDGDPTTAWCQAALGDELTVTFTPRADVRIEIDRDDDVPLRVTVSGVIGSHVITEPGPATLSFHQSGRKIDWITIAPFADKPACVREVEVSSPVAAPTPAPAPISTPAPASTSTPAHAHAPPPIAPARTLHPTPRPPRPRWTPPITNDVLARAPDAIRALRLAIAERDPEWLAMWVDYPLPIGADLVVASAREHADACRRGAALAAAPDDTDLQAAIAGITIQAAGTIAVRFPAVTWRLAWRKRQWWLVAIDGVSSDHDARSLDH